VRISTIKSLLVALTRILEEHNIEHWISRGTLLGSYRDAKIIPWDLDADIGLTYEALGKLLLVSAQPNFTLSCDKCLFLFRKGKHAHVIPFKFINTTNGIYVDSFLYVRTNMSDDNSDYITRWPLKCYRCTREGFQISKSIIYPLKKECIIDGVSYYCPAKEKEYLTLWYRDLRPKPPKNWSKIKMELEEDTIKYTGGP